MVRILLPLLAVVATLASGNLASDNTVRRAQYRGPVEQLLAAGPSGPEGGPIGAGGGAGGPLLNPVGFLEGFNRWEFWFEINKDVLLRSRDFRRRELFPPTEPEAGAPSPPDDGRVRADDARSAIARMLKGALKSSDERVVRFAALGLGRVGTKDTLDTLEPIAASKDPETRRIGTLAIGLVNDRAALSRLVNMLGDAESPPEARVAAALAIGLHGRREGSRFLVDYLKKHLTPATVLGADKDVFAAAVVGIGLCRDHAAAPYLRATYTSLHEERQGRTRPLETAILTALGRIGDPVGLLSLLDALDDKDLDLRRAAALALGDLGQSAAVSPLVSALEEDHDDQVRGFAAISLGRLGGDRARDALRRGFASRASRTVKSFSAIGLGLAGDRSSSPDLLRALVDKSDENLRGAYAIALGLLGDARAVEPLLKIVESHSGAAEFRGYCAIALGMIRAEGALDHLLKLLEKDNDRVEVWRRALCLGIGLFGDPKAGPALRRVLVEDDRDVVREHAALALNLLRPRSEIDPLGAILEKESRGDLALFTVAALSGLGDRYDYPVVSETFFNSNYRIRLPLLEELQQVL